jgi:hypothetical protein
MNFFGGSNCGEMNRENGGGFDCCTLIFLILLLQNCGCGFLKDGINVDCGTILLLLLLSNFGCGCNK